ncbi:methyltransferase [Streptomyces roseicoloratus]|uniref:Methyltransferase n=1 Tax=Streptomyces roseicoloratus TaxID=2508722 RepID=A0ABY9RUE4_9ACTN|nr:methyltransferase [Streptomyces roseicoloratus]WMX44550.1 methyltransferase [Streptomyces roseicoloratus]
MRAAPPRRTGTGTGTGIGTGTGTDAGSDRGGDAGTGTRPGSSVNTATRGDARVATRVATRGDARRGRRRPPLGADPGRPPAALRRAEPARLQHRRQRARHDPPWELVADVVRTGRPATRTVWGVDHWEYYAANPDEARSYAETCASLSVEAAEALVASCDLAEEREIVDVGGSPGTVLARLLREVPGARGVLLDLPWAVGFARETFEKDGLTGRVELVAGDFRHEVPAGGSLYLLKNVLCDLDDEAAAQLLANCAKAADPGGRLVLLDWEYTEHSSHVHANDVEFMVLTGGRARTEDQYRELLTAAGFAHCRRLPLVGHERAPIALIESVRA